MENSKNDKTSQDITEYEDLSTNPPVPRSSPSSPDCGDVAIEIGAISGVEPEQNDPEQGDDTGEEPDEKDVGREDDDSGSSYSLSPSQLEIDVGYSDWPAPTGPIGKEGKWDSSTSDYFDEYCRPDSSDVAVSWTDPLSKPLRTISRENVQVDMQIYPFLAGFLCKRRSLDTLPFLTRHRLIFLILHTLQDSCYELMKSKYPDQLRYTQIQCVDQIDIFDWTAFIGGVRAQEHQKFQNEVWPSPQISQGGPLGVGDVRQVAYHRQDYDNRLILYAVCLLVQLKDSDRLHKIQSVLLLLYQKQCQAEDINPESTNPEHKFLSEDEISAAEPLLDIDSRACTTQQQMLSKIQAILERSFFRLAFAHDPEYFQQLQIDFAEQIELHHWYDRHNRVLLDSIIPDKRDGFSHLLSSASRLRNQASHPSINPAFDRRWADWAIKILGHCDDQESIAQIKMLADSTETQVEEATRARVDTYPNDADGLLELYTECHAAGAAYMRDLRGLYKKLTQHEEAIGNIFDRAARDFRERYEQALKTEAGDTETSAQSTSNPPTIIVTDEAGSPVEGSAAVEDVDR
ncbi:hypothetical protein G7Y79_00002g007240 [Physcia stellaris]|nr:hypothetical protein G7Y79_00002g007240 [Physcia stellaris]